MRWVMVINLSKCVRCHACVAACRIEHFLPLHVTWPRLIAWEQETRNGANVTTVPVRCNQCKEAPCVDRDATPTCVNTCQARALTFGDLDDPASEVSRLIKEKKGFQLHPEYETDPSVFYIDPGIGNALCERIAP
jgi:Fe-S-cluster-containing dehydrogenase component